MNGVGINAPNEVLFSNVEMNIEGTVRLAKRWSEGHKREKCLYCFDITSIKMAEE